MKRIAWITFVIGLTITGVLWLHSSKAVRSNKNEAPIKVICLKEWLPVLEILQDGYQTEVGETLSLKAVQADAISGEFLSNTHGDLLILPWNQTVEQAKASGALREILFFHDPSSIQDLKNDSAPSPYPQVAAVSSACRLPSMALRFARYIASPQKGGRILEQRGFPGTDGDEWALTPELVLYSGGVNRPAIEPLLKDFANREGVRVTTVFNGCGILCASMKTLLENKDAKFPDAYYACDLCFVSPVADIFPESTLLTETDIGIVVQKDNPREIETLADLAKPGLRIGLCNARQSTLGYMTEGMLRSSGLLSSIRKNVEVEVPTADFLINQMRSGGLDAAIVYRVNVHSGLTDLKYLPISHPGAKAVQPFSIRKDSPNRHLGNRLLEFLKANRESFEKEGFRWNEQGETIPSKDIEIPEWLK